MLGSACFGGLMSACEASQQGTKLSGPTCTSDYRQTPGAPLWKERLDCDDVHGRQCRDRVVPLSNAKMTGSKWDQCRIAQAYLTLLDVTDGDGIMKFAISL